MKLLTTSALIAFAASASLVSAQDDKKSDIIDTAVAAGSFKTLATALKQANLITALKGKGPFTVFAPTDAAFAKLPKGAIANLLKPKNKQALSDILTYHVVSGSLPAKKVVAQKGLATLNGQRAGLSVSKKGAQIAGAMIVKTDIQCSNGVIHVIDAVMMPVQSTVLEVAGKAGSFKTLAAAIKAAGLVDTLQGKGPFTVFAPTDAAFAKLPKDTLASLLKPENKKKLAAILTYHVVAGRKFATEVVTSKSLKSVQGSAIPVKLKKGKAMVGGATIVKTDINAQNGVIHVIDTVILPPSK